MNRFMALPGDIGNPNTYQHAKIWTCRLFDRIRRPQLDAQDSRFERYCTGCSTHHWEDLPTADRASIRKYLAAYGFHAFSLRPLAPMHFLVMHTVSDPESGPTRDFMECSSNTNGGAAPSSSNANGRFLYILQNVRGWWGPFEIIEQDTFNIPTEADLRDKLYKMYNENQGPLFKLLYGNPMGVGYIQFHPSSDGLRAITQGPVTPELKMSSHAFLRFWSSTHKERERGALDILPLDERSIKEGGNFSPREPFIGIYPIHRPWWILFVFFVCFGIPVGILWKSADAPSKYWFILVAIIFLAFVDKVVWNWATRLESEWRVP